MANTFYINWQDPVSRSWYPVAKLVRDDDLYFFAYTKGAMKSKYFLPFGNMSDLKSVYVSSQLFPIFANRVMNEKRPDYHRYLQWSGLNDGNSHDPVLLMATMGGARATDTLQVYPVPEQGEERLYRTFFFCHGLRHLPEEVQNRVEYLKPGERVFPMLDSQNLYDERAVALRTGDPATLIGYCPRYLAPDMIKLSKIRKARLEITIKQVNIDAPVQYRLLCEAVALWPEQFAPCSDHDHETIAQFNIADLSTQARRHWNDEGKQRALF